MIERAWIDLPGYVPAERPWFVGALLNPAQDEVFRTMPYHFLELGPSIQSAVSAWKRSGRTPEEPVSFRAGDVSA